MKPAQDALRVPPQSVDAEQAVIGGLLLAPESMDRVRDCLTEQDFYRRDHRLIYRAICELSEKNKLFDAVTLGEWFEAHSLAEQAGGASYLIELASTTPSAANIRAYAEIVREKSVLRQLIEAGTGIVNDAFRPDGRAAMDLVCASQARLGAVLQNEPAELEPATAVLRRLNDQHARRIETGGALDGLSTGYDDLDRLLCGLKPGQLVVVAGRPKMGKTTLAMNIGEHVAIRLGKRVAVHSLEMPPEQLLERSCCSVGRVPHEVVRRGEMSDEQGAIYAKAGGKLSRADLVLSKPRSVRIEQLIAQTRRAHAEAPFGLVVIDYLQLIDMGGAERRDIGVGDVTRALKLMAVSIGVPVLLLSQLNRNLEGRPEKRPTPSDLRDGGGIEQDADVVLFVYRDEVYNPDSPDRGTAEVIVGLQRSGPTGMARLSARLDLCRFDSLNDDWRPSPIAARSTRRSTGFGAHLKGGQDRAANE